MIAAAAVVVVAIIIFQASAAYAADALTIPDLLNPDHTPKAQEVKASHPEANLPYLFAVYILTWAGFFGYIFLMARRQKEMRRDIETLKTMLSKSKKSTRNDP